MPRLYFDLSDGKQISSDDEGAEPPEMLAARWAHVHVLVEPPPKSLANRFANAFVLMLAYHHEHDC